MEKIKVGIIGCGDISRAYLKNCQQVFEILEVTACADVIPERAAQRAAEFAVPKAATVEQLLADDEIQVVINLTPPAAHASLAMQCLQAGKSVYNEKPLAITRREGKKLLALAKAKGLRVGCAPDTFMGAGLQTCRKLIDAGRIGQPVAAVAFMTGHGPEGWHPNPDFFYKHGGGPMLDMGPYYITALVTLLGPVRRVTGSAQISFPQRTVTRKSDAGRAIDVEVPTHVAAVADFAAGAVATMVMSFDVWAAQLPRIEIYGSEGSLSVPDPNRFSGPVQIRGAGEKQWTDVPLVEGYTENSRGIGPADMAHAIATGRAHRASGELAYHVLDVMTACQEASDKNQHVRIASTADRPAPLPTDLPLGRLDD